ncbi:hypothetical protein AN639_04100 [Candidatus Epulonipiscium fishelsonii]|uniref:Uncharacterized protein n=1 Tax=Candidatus Epulonipiscium fishelsonii TaxID=77094 RepID=A0ACC8XH18_9FIRM|nr:hypothetical protein AN639_04100 [Epulopiscium sp. SCG-B05WGA-EpuloA1]ONI42842.1 hypothetical protein AN396_12980 [Epulopiscium sp. SCG-B11WGA-EpuloA1]
MKGYFYKTITKEGYVAIVAGLHKRNYKADFKDLEMNLENLEINGLDIVQIDENLLEIIVKYGKNKFIFVGGCVIADIVGEYSSGGVIGNPNISPNCAQGLFEDVGHGFTLLSYPSSPGVLYKENTEINKYLLKTLKQSSMKIEVVKEIAKL